MKCDKKYKLLTDENFIQWVLFPTYDLESYWHTKMDVDCEIKENILEIKKILLRLKVQEHDLADTDKEILWEGIVAESINKKKRIYLGQWLKYAAMFIGIIIFGAGLYIVHNKFNERSVFDYTSILEKEDSENVDQKNICLILPNAERIEIPDLSVEFVHNKDGDIQVNSDQVISNITQDEINNEVQFNQLIVPYGRSSSLVLSDGTKIWMNSGSKLIYPVHFKKDRREIFIEGEAYLEVTKNEEQPFYVKTDLWEVRVTGTSFNVCAYKGELIQSIVLVTGSVTVKNIESKEKIILKPNQICLYQAGAEKIEVNEVDIYDHICWKYGFLHFKSERLDFVLNRLRRFYNIQIVCSEEIRKIKVSGKLDMKDNIDEVFKAISITAPIYYSKEKNKIDVKPLK